MEQTIIKKRIESIDIVRGIAMLIMALDHLRDYFHITANTDDPLNLETTHPALFFTRFITHFCAPIFIFLSGTSIYLQSLRKTKKELGVFLIKRGLWLILVEWTIVAFAWTFNPSFSILPFQVIWAIGISMVVLGIFTLLRLPYIAIFAIGIVLVAGHNLLDAYEAAPHFKAGFWWDLFHHGAFVTYPITDNHVAMLVYPFPPWTGVMMLGYCSGILFTSNYTSAIRRKILIRIGIGLIVFFMLLRFSNLYGDPVPWSQQSTFFYSFLSFIKVNKYPPSLLYVCITMGPALILLALLEKPKNKLTDGLVVFGRTAFFYYIVHLYVIHLVATILFFVRGHTMEEAGNIGEKFPFLFVVPGEGIGLAGLYILWILLIAALYPLCKWYDKYKTKHTEIWWLSYF